MGRPEETGTVESDPVGVFRVNIGMNALRRSKIPKDATKKVRGVGRAEKSE